MAIFHLWFFVCHSVYFSVSLCPTYIDRYPRCSALPSSIPALLLLYLLLYFLCIYTTRSPSIQKSWHMPGLSIRYHFIWWSRSRTQDAVLRPLDPQILYKELWIGWYESSSQRSASQRWQGDHDISKRSNAWAICLMYMAASNRVYAKRASRIYVGCDLTYKIWTLATRPNTGSTS